MDVMNVFVIFDITKFSKEQIVDELVGEGYRHNFMFDNMVYPKSVLENYLDQSDEVWCFGKCEGSQAHTLAIKKGFDVWQMG